MADEQTVDTQNQEANQGSAASGEDLAARVQVLE
jgi:molecular chaperone GrpE